MTIRGLFKIHPGRFIGIVLSYLISSVTLVLNSFILMYLVDCLKDRNLTKWTTFLILDIFVSICSYLFPRLAAYFTEKQIQEYNHVVRQKIIQKYYIDKKDIKVSDAQNHMINDLQIINENYLSNFFFTISDVATILFAAVTLLLIHWLLLIVTLLVVAASVFIPKFLDKTLVNITNNMSLMNQKYLNFLHEWLSGIEELRHYLAGNKLFAVARFKQKQLKNSYVKYTQKMQLVTLLNGISSNVFSLVLYIVAGILIANKMILFGAILAIGNYHYYISGAIKDINYNLQTMKSADDLNSKVKSETQVAAISQRSKTITASGINVNNLSFDYDQRHIEYPDFIIQPGEKVLLTGNNGCGKSTLLDLIAGDKQSFIGKIDFFDKNCEKKSLKDLQLNYLRQKVIIFPGTYLDNIAMFNSKYDEIATEKVEQLGLSNKLASTNYKFSGGQEQMISILRHMVHPSSILLIDEGLSGIDDENKELILKGLSGVSATVVLVEHNLNYKLKKYFDREIRI